MKSVAFASVEFLTLHICQDHRQLQKFFQRGQSRHFAYSFQVADGAMHMMYIQKMLYPF